MRYFRPEAFGLTMGFGEVEWRADTGSARKAQVRSQQSLPSCLSQVSQVPQSLLDDHLVLFRQYLPDFALGVDP